MYGWVGQWVCLCSCFCRFLWMGMFLFESAYLQGCLIRKPKIESKCISFFVIVCLCVILCVRVYVMVCGCGWMD